ncbi:MAG: tetratricopeptide repeat protein [Nitrospiraceae bacterium]|nr:MAG: tetratricopeptide repeat protein [Nitrospiraceae bacterium]
MEELTITEQPMRDVHVMMSEEFSELESRGIEECDSGNTLVALMYLEKASQKGKTPLLDSYLAYCLAREHNSYSEAIELGKGAMNEQSGNLVLYLNLAKIYILAGQRNNALKVLRQATKRGRDGRILRLIKNLGIRKKPVLPCLQRGNLINIFLGKLRHKCLN